MSKDISHLIQNENDEFVESNCETYINIFIKDLNWLIYLAIIPIVLIYMYLGIWITYYYGFSIKNSENKILFWKYWLLNVMYYVIYIFIGSIITFLIYFSTIRKARLLHEKMIKRIIGAPVNTYFDKTPSGTILNRFTRDIGKLDGEAYR